MVNLEFTLRETIKRLNAKIKDEENKPGEKESYAQTEDFTGDFYKRAIEIHENRSLRRFANLTGRFDIVKTKTYYLEYNKQGFCFGLLWDTKPYSVSNGQLMVKIKGEKWPMLEAFPDLTLTVVESELDEEIWRRGSKRVIGLPGARQRGVRGLFDGNI